MTKKGRLGLLAKLTKHFEENGNRNSKYLDFANRDNPVIGYYADGKVYRYQVLLLNGDNVSINEHGNTCHYYKKTGNEIYKLDNLFAENDCLGFTSAVDRRISGIRDNITRKKRIKSYG